MNLCDSPTLSGLLLPRETLLGGLKIDGEWFPPGIDLGVPACTLHHNAEYFPDPFEFRPGALASYG